MSQSFGTKQTRRDFNYVADFCPYCRCVTRQHLFRIGEAWHVNFAAIGEGNLQGYEAVCLSCGGPKIVQPEDFIQSVPLAQIHILIRDTNPSIRIKYHDKLELEKKASESFSQLTPKERLTLLASPLEAISPVVNRQATAKSYDLSSWIWLFIGALFASFSKPIAEFLFPNNSDSAIPAVMFAIMLPPMINMGFSYRRYLKRKIDPLLAQALRHLQPTEDEISQVLESLRSQPNSLGKRYNSQQIMNIIKSQPSKSSATLFAVFG